MIQKEIETHSLGNLTLQETIWPNSFIWGFHLLSMEPMMSKAWSGASLVVALDLVAKTHDLHGRALNGHDLKDELSVPRVL